MGVDIHDQRKLLDLQRAYARRMGGAGIRRNIRGPQGGGGGVDPVGALFSTAYARWRADTGVTLDAGVASNWADMVNSRNLIQSTASARPTPTTAYFGGQAALSFDGTDDTMVSDQAAADWKFLHDGTGGSVFYVARISSSPFRRVVCATNNAVRFSGVGMAIGRWSTPDFFFMVRGSGTPVINISTTALTEPSSSWNTAEYSTAAGGTLASSGSVLVTAAEAATPSTGAPSHTFWIGGGYFGPMEIAELAVFPTVLGAPNRALLSAYAVSRYGVAA